MRRADALAWMTYRVFDGGGTPVLSPHRHKVVVHVYAEVLAHGGAGRCKIGHHVHYWAEGSPEKNS